jgi:hypothetical protein
MTVSLAIEGVIIRSRNLGTHRFQRAVSAGGAFENQWAASPRLHAGSDANLGRLPIYAQDSNSWLHSTFICTVFRYLSGSLALG